MRELGVIVENLPNYQIGPERDMVNSLFNFMTNTRNTTDWLLRPNVNRITADHDVDSNNFILLCDATAGSITINLPDASANESKILYIKKIDASANTVTIEPFGSQLIEGNSNLVIGTQYDSPEIVCDGTEWWII